MPLPADAAAAPSGSELRFILPVAGLMLGGLALVCALIGLGGRQQDDLALQHERRRVEHAIASTISDLGVSAKDYSWWDEAVANVVHSFDADWIDSNPGVYVNGTFGYEYSFILDGAGQTRYAAVDGERAEVDAFAALSPRLAELVARARRSPQDEPLPATGLLRDAEGVVAVAASVILPQSGSALSLPPGPRSILIFAQRLDADFLESIAEGYGLRRLQLLPAPAVAPPAAVALSAADGTRLGLLTWQPERPGREVLRRTMPWLLGALAVFAAFTIAVMRSIRRAAAAIRFSETRFRDIAEASSDWIWETDADLQIKFVSERFEALAGLGREAVLGHRLPELLHPAESPERWQRHLGDLAARRSFRDLRCRLAGLEQQTLRVAGKPILDAAGQFQGYRGTATDISATLEAEAQAWHAARHDPMTGLPNRLLLRERIAQALAEHRRSRIAAAVWCLDLDHFKEINDRLGHPAGDLLIRGAAERLAASVRETDTVARLGGDEFALLQGGVQSLAEVQRLGERLLAALSRPCALDGHQVMVTASLGVAIVGLDGEDPDSLLRHADIALFRAKSAGRHCFRFFEPGMDAELRARKRLEEELRHALERGELEVHYQPQIDLHSGALAGVEALLRWQHPERGLIVAGEFIEIAEETGLILAIGEWLLPAACREVAAWPGLRLSVNLSPVQFRHRDLAAMVAAALAGPGLAPDRLELEIAESVLLQDSQAALATLMQLKDQGVRIAIGDFGTAESSLSYLRRFHFDKIKIDRSIIQALDRGGDPAAIVKAVVGLAHGLGIETCAEGVEHEDQLRLLEGDGCDEVQGHLFSRPLPAAALAAFIERAQARPPLREIGVDSAGRRA